MPPLSEIPSWVWLTLAFWVGACVGSFLNVVIYRLPLGLSVNKPRRSFCPSCKHQLTWWQNIPLFSWPLLKGKCGFCGKPVSVRYWAIELLTAGLFLYVAHKFPLEQSLCYMLFVSLLIAGTFIDVDHMIIPHRITFGIIGSGLFCSTLVPSLMGETESWRGFLFSLTSAGLGLGLLWMVVELGKLLFGKIRWQFENPEPWEISQKTDDHPPELKVGDDVLDWHDIFQRPKQDRILLTCQEIRLGDKIYRDCTAKVFYNRVEVLVAGEAPRIFPLEELEKVSGTSREMVIPREAMGFADVLLIAGVGAFLGWKAVLFTILAGSVIGSVWGMLPKLFGKAVFGKPMPFGPHLALGAVLWLFVGPQIFNWYLKFVMPVE